uniref:RNA-directed DNA polymerase, eukaryota n=1 Tax=Tanacetum cinerariifolium TaxID=118510 RepID=A0A699GTW3_TANCI|nr:RNA-directed DNA polymerase, eukaryota [Tanacetum cinerariifolium]
MHLKNQGTDLCGFIQKKIGNGIDTSFWEEIWGGDSAFKFLYPRLYALESCKSIAVAEKLGHTNLASSFRRHPRGGIEQEQFLHLSTRLDDTCLVDMRDRWSWLLDGTGEFSVASVRKMIDECYLPEISSKTRWIKVMPIKINIHAWKVKMDCLPTRLNISRQARQVWVKIASWWDVNYMVFSSYAKWLDWFSSLQLHPKHKNLFEGVCFTMWWYMWNFRNKSIFRRVPPNKASIYEDIISRSFFGLDIDFHMGLGDACQPIRSNILTRDPFLFVEAAFAVVFGKKSYRNETFMGNTSKAPSPTPSAAKSFD